MKITNKQTDKQTIYFTLLISNRKYDMYRTEHFKSSLLFAITSSGTTENKTHKMKYKNKWM